MNRLIPRAVTVLLLVLLLAVGSLASAYNGRPKLVVLIVVDQLRGDLLERYHDEFTEGGFRLLMDHGAYYTNCYYQYANTRTAPGHATIGTGTYTLGHGILANDYWDSTVKRKIDLTEDSNFKRIGGTASGVGSSPMRLQATTFADELKLATGGRSRTYGVAFKDRAALLPVGFTADGAFWIDRSNGQWVTSTYYMAQAPDWLLEFNNGDRASKYLNRDWKDGQGKLIGDTRPKDRHGKPANYYDNVGSTPYGNDSTIEFARELIERERIGESATTDFLSVSFSPPDILGHDVGPDSPVDHAMLLALDKQLAEFFAYLQRRVGKENLVIALSADHGDSPVPEYARSLRMPAKNVKPDNPRAQLNAALSKSLGKTAEYVPHFLFPLAYLNPEAFAAVNMNEADAERATGEAMFTIGMRGYVTKSQLASGNVPSDVFREKYLNSYTPLYGWWLMGKVAPFTVSEYPNGTDHALPYSYDSHVPLGFYGAAFRTEVFRNAVEPVDLAVTLSSLLGINMPSSAVGHVRTEAFGAPVKSGQATKESR
jgi:hypothetical protein